MSKDHIHGVSGIMCGHVHDGTRPLRMIEHTPDGDWDFMCGAQDHDTQEAIDAAVVVCKGCAMAQIAVPNAVQQMPRAHVADYDARRETWDIRPLSEDEVAAYFHDA